jgi:hypothetical protein
VDNVLFIAIGKQMSVRNVDNGNLYFFGFFCKCLNYDDFYDKVHAVVTLETNVYVTTLRFWDRQKWFEVSRLSNAAAELQTDVRWDV